MLRWPCRPPLPPPSLCVNVYVHMGVHTHSQHISTKVRTRCILSDCNFVKWLLTPHVGSWLTPQGKISLYHTRLIMWASSLNFKMRLMIHSSSKCRGGLSGWKSVMRTGWGKVWKSQNTYPSCLLSGITINCLQSKHSHPASIQLIP